MFPFDEGWTIGSAIFERSGLTKTTIPSILSLVAETFTVMVDSLVTLLILVRQLPSNRDCADAQAGTKASPAKIANLKTLICASEPERLDTNDMCSGPVGES